MTIHHYLQLPAIIWQIIKELRRSYAKHGNWEDRGYYMPIDVIAGELDESKQAMHRMDRDGEHGYRAEFAQVAACAIKGILER